jgi:hypothetical protein
MKNAIMKPILFSLVFGGTFAGCVKAPLHHQGHGHHSVPGLVLADMGDEARLSEARGLLSEVVDTCEPFTNALIALDCQSEPCVALTWAGQSWETLTCGLDIPGTYLTDLSVGDGRADITWSLFALRELDAEAIEEERTRAIASHPGDLATQLKAALARGR